MFGSFVGGHTNDMKDPGSDVNWIAKETWDFFMRFQCYTAGAEGEIPPVGRNDSLFGV